MRLEGAIFDMDGTLLDSTSIWKTAGSSLLRELGQTPEPELDRRLMTMGLHEGAAYCKKRYGLSQSEDELVALADSRVDHFYREAVCAKPGAEKFLSLLKMQGVWLYLATATDRPQAEAALKRTGLSGFFRGILTCTEAGCGKTSPVIFEKCLTRLRCPKAGCVVFEDSLHAVQTAKRAGFRVAAVYDAGAEQDQPELQRVADYYIRSYDEWLSSDQE